MLSKEIPLRSSIAKDALKKYGNALYKPYQEQGLRWLLKRELDTNRYCGGFLCDDMGLGKTIQFISLILANPLPNTLLILPASLISQWQEQFKKFAPELEIFVHHGQNRITNIDMVLSRPHPKPIVWITSYTLMRDNSIFTQIYWDRVILEESHIIRNSSSQTTKVAYKLKSNIRWGITGTPIQNSIKDLVSLFQFIGISKHIFMENIDKARNIFILRRTKSQLKDFNVKLQIPPIYLKTIDIPFASKEEALFYKKVRGEVNLESKLLRLFPFNHVRMLEMVLRLRQACILPQLVINGYKKKWKSQYPDWTGTNTKLDYIINSIHLNNHRAIVFSNFKDESKYLSDKLTLLGFNPRIIQGASSIQERANIIQSCQTITDKSNPNYIDILVVQINAGGTGLNLQMFNTVYFTSPNWNPALEMQAIARAHRIGQTLPVTIIKPIIRSNDISTIEQRIMDKQKLKNANIVDFLKDTNILQYTSFTKDDIMILLK